MRMGQGVRTGLGHGGITCVLQTQFSSFFLFYFLSVLVITICHLELFPRLFIFLLVHYASVYAPM